jgi:sortase A
MGVTMRRKRRNGGEGTAARQWQPLTFEQATDVADVVQLRRSLRRRMIALRVFAIVLAIVAVVVGATPFVLQWRSSQQLSAQTRMVNQRVLGWPYPQAENKLRDARAYNQRLAASGQPILGEAVDPFSQRAGGSSVSEKGDSAASKDSEYQSLLDTGGGIMGVGEHSEDQREPAHIPRYVGGGARRGGGAFVWHEPACGRPEHACGDHRPPWPGGCPHVHETR